MAGFRERLGRFVGLQQKREHASSDSSAIGPPKAFVPIAKENNDFSVAVYNELRATPGNLFCSPFSLRIVLAMALVGARGDTASQMAEVLRIPASDHEPGTAVSNVIHRLQTSRGVRYELAVANSLWCQDGISLQTAFLDLMKDHYGCELNFVDFRRGVEKARAAINRWVEGQTRGRIRDLIPFGGLGAHALLVLVNAIYFKGRWSWPFEKAQTSVEPFHLQSGGTVRAYLMHLRGGFRYLGTTGFQAVELVYEGGDLSMLVILPRRKKALPDLEKRLSWQLIHGCVSKMNGEEVSLFLPRFKFISGPFELNRHLSALGMRHAFNQSLADFSGINGCRPTDEDAVSISSIFQKAFVEVNEEGTEAAAATAMIQRPVSSRLPLLPRPVRVFRADHPFLFAILDRGSDRILFIGRVSDPTK